MSVRTLSVFLGLLLTFGLPVYADTIVSVSVPDHCTVTDTDSVSHSYSGGYFGICALQTAVNSGSISGVLFSNAFPAFGLFVTSVGGVAADQSSQYWALYQNGAFASLGLSQLPVAVGDTVTLELHNFSEEFLGSRFTLNISSLISTAPSPTPVVSSGSGGLTLHDPFTVPLAVNYLGTMEKSDGSFGSALLDDWAAIMTGTGAAGDIQKRLIGYFSVRPPALTSVTDFERHAMALEALGVNPYNGTPVDYITPIVKAFDGTQIGESSLINDDIFALFPLLHAGYTASDDIIQKTVAFILAGQQKSGSWADSVDITAAAIQALETVRSLPGTDAAVRKAAQYLHAQQATDGGFGNSQATSWVLQAVSSLGESVYDWNAGIYQMPDYYLATKQYSDGGVEPQSSDMQTRVWATAYAIPAALAKPWDTLLQSFPKPVPAPAPEVATTTSVTTSTETTQTNIAAQLPTQQINDVVLPAEPAPEAATTTKLSQTAAAAATQTTPAWDKKMWLWFFGLLLIFFLTYFLNRKK